MNYASLLLDDVITGKFIPSNASEWWVGELSQKVDDEPYNLNGSCTTFSQDFSHKPCDIHPRHTLCKHLAYGDHDPD